MIEEIKKELLKTCDKKYKNFSTSLLPGVNNVIGVRLPVLRKIAQKIIKENKARIFFKENDDEFMELTMLEGMIIGYSEVCELEKQKLIKKFIPKINCWSVCDSFCATLKNCNLKKDFLEPYFKSKKEYDLRFAFVILLMYFDKDYDYAIKKLTAFNNDAYYAKMAASWALSIFIIKNYDKCIKDIKTKDFHPFVYKKGITKAIESFRLNKKQKEELKKLRLLK